jgi:hypothetical protein
MGYWSVGFRKISSAVYLENQREGRMRMAAREQAWETSWDRIFEGMYEAQERCLCGVPEERNDVFDVASSDVASSEPASRARTLIHSRLRRQG